ncbi:hypothetical protein AY606_04615 [Acinetobacter sp. SFB]|uniref:hypothetical protein n=1 Tax=Acinetobacter sp. SFB TaxID=1805634 RepID=UPI0007D7D11D|nr:hypothetical protein [Acinetobacter sp. SFB]OAL79931.1 hypothetical protein AY606_04615 [Acinetobacter sp. SFB]
MKLGFAKAALFIFSLMAFLCLSLGFSRHDLSIMALGILLVFCIIVSGLEYKKLNSNPFA